MSTAAKSSPLAQHSLLLTRAFVSINPSFHHPPFHSSPLFLCIISIPIHTMVVPHTAFKYNFIQTKHSSYWSSTMPGNTTSQSNSKRKAPHSRTAATSKHKAVLNTPPTHDSKRSGERNHRSLTKHHKFSYPESRKLTKSQNTLQLSPSPHSSSSNKHYVFVYGTLKKGFANSHLLDRATLLGEFRTITRYPLVVGGKYNSPYLLDMPSQGSRVKGELYAVDDSALTDLDYLENVGVNYTRRVAKVSNCADRSFVAAAYVYLKTNGLEELSKSEFLDDYQCRRYVPRHLRSKQLTGSAVVAMASGR